MGEVGSSADWSNRPPIIAAVYYGSRVFSKYGSLAGTRASTEDREDDEAGERAPLLA